MATGDATPTVTPDPSAAPSAAPAAAAAPASPVAPDIAAPTPAPVDVTSGTPQPNLQTAALGSYAQTLGAEQTAAQKAADIANQPPPGPMKHATLFRIISAIGAGLSGAGTAIATHGKEGGAPEVEEIMGAQQQRQLQKTQAVQAQRDAQIRQQQTIAETNHALGQQFLLLATLPTDLALNDLKLPQAQAALVADKASAAKTQAEFMSQYGTSTDQFNNMMSGNPQAVDPNDAKNLVTFAQQKIDAASKILPSNDPFLQKAQTTLANPNSTPAQVFSAMSSVNRQLGLQQQVEEAKSKKETAQANDPVAKLSTPESLAAPGAQAAILAKINDPTTDPVDIPRFQKLLGQAGVAQANAEAIKRREAAADQAIKMGDPTQAGTLLRNHQTTISELKSRGMTPEYIVKAVNAAGPGYNAIEADNQAKLAGSEANNQFFGNVNSLISKNGTLDQLADAGSKISQDDLRILNKTKNWAQLQGGKAGISAYAAKMVGVADDYAKVMGGSSGSDTSRGLVLQIVDPSLSPAQRAASIQAMKDAVNSQKTARIANNPFLQDMYGNAGENTSATSSSNPYGAVPR
jgi:hypothetical protein